MLSSSLKTASVDETDWHDCCEGNSSNEGNYIDWLTIDEQSQSVLDNVTRIRDHPLVPGDILIYSYI